MCKNRWLQKIAMMSLLVFGVNLLYPTNLGTVKGVNKPNMMEVAGAELYIVEGAVISVYSLEDLQLLRQFGRAGEGPGELKVVPYYNNKISVFPGFILAESVDKLVYFAKDGTFIKQIRKPVDSGFFVPLGKNFVGKKVKPDSEQKVLFEIINLYDPELYEIKELYRQKFPQQGSGQNVTVELFSDFVNFQVQEDKLFIEKSPEGFVIDVFDSEGRSLYRIEKEYEKTKVTNAYKEAAINQLKEDPTIKRQMKRVGGWENLTKTMEFTFPDYLPAIQNIEIANGKIYLKTFQKKDINDEYIVMDLKGKILRNTYIPQVYPLSIKDQLVGVKMAAIRDDKLYFLNEEEEAEVWELHVYDIK